MNNLLLALADLFVIHLGYVLTFVIRYQGTIPQENFPSYLAVAPWLSLAAVIWFGFYGLYDVVKKRWNEVFYSLACAVVLIMVSAVFISFIGRQFAFPRSVLAISVFVQLLLLSIWRHLHWKMARQQFGTAGVIVVGGRDEAQKDAAKLLDAMQELVAVQGIITTDADFSSEPLAANFPVLGAISDGERILRRENPNSVLICSGVGLEEKKELIAVCLTRGIEIQLVPDLYEIFMVNASFSQIDDIPVCTLRHNELPAGNAFGKRLLDISIALFVLILALPLMLLIAFWIKADSPGTVFLRQERLSERGETFRLFKFRTMIRDAEETSGPVLATEDDPRITRVGRILRKTRIDEIPQLINVLKGEMSIIGPRPERPFFVERFSREIPAYRYRLAMKAGITGLAQVSGKYSTSPEDKLRYDLLYSRTHSPFRDFIILLHTVKVMLMRDKAS